MSGFVQGRAAWAVWATAVLAYAVAVMHRSSLGVAGLEAAAHFQISAGVVSTFVVLQLAVYALAQVPVGVLLDRLGSRVIITGGSLVTGVSQVLLATADDLSAAYVARILLGIGDACIFNAVLRLLPRWFAPRSVPVMSQITGMVGATGQIGAVLLILPAIHGFGWTNGLLVGAISCLVVAVAALVAVRDAPPGSGETTVRDSWREVPGKLASVVSHPATQLGFWVHFTCGFSYNTFVFMWGMPYLVITHGMSKVAAGALFTVMAVAAMVAGPVLGTLTARHPLRRSTLALLMVSCSILVWCVVLLMPGRAPLPLLVLLVIVVAATNPATSIGFDFPRTSLPPTRLGVANGVVIAGSFTGSTILILLMGMFLDHVSGGSGTYTPVQLRLAWSLQFPFYAIGIAGIVVSRRALRRGLGVVVPPWGEVVDRLRHRR